MKTVGALRAARMLNRMRPGQTNVRYVVGPTADYGGYVEHGTSRMAAQPYMAPAAREAQGNVASHLKSAPNLETAISSVAYDVERGAKARCPVRTGYLRSSIHVRKA